MSLITKMYEKKIKEVSSTKNLTNYHKRKRIWAFVNSTMFICDVIMKREEKKNKWVMDNEFHINKTEDYTWISREDFQEQICDNKLYQECMNYLKDEGIIDVFKKDGREYYIHFPMDGKDRCSKAYKLTDKFWNIFKNTSKEEFDQFIDSIEVTCIPRKKYVQPTPKKIMENVKQDFWFKNTKENITHILENDLELEFHPTSVEELVKLYNQQRKEDGEEEVSLEQIEFNICQRIDQFAINSFNYNVRLYTPFTNTPRSWRRFVTTKTKKSIKDLFDIPSSIINILPLVCRIELLKNGCDEEMFKKFEAEEKRLEEQLERRYDKVNPVHIYNIIGGEEFEKEQIKNAVMKVFFSNNKSFESIIKFERTKKGKLKHNAPNAVRMWLKNNYPIMFDVVAKYEQMWDSGDKRYKSQFWKAFQQIETELMCELIVRAENRFGIKIYGLHDGCFHETGLYSVETTKEMENYCKNELNNLKNELKQLINEKYPLIEEQKNDTNVPEWIADQVPTKKQVLERIEKNKDFDLDEYANQKIYEEQQKQKAIAWAKEQKQNMGAN